MPVAQDLDPDVQHCLRSGIAALETHGLAAAPDASTPCSAWTAYDLVRHVESIAGAYVLWVGAAMGGRRRHALAEHEMAEFNQMLLARLPEQSLGNHLQRAVDLAHDHTRLAGAGADLPMTEFDNNEVWTVGDHAGVAALEYHVHAWDLAQASEATHLPTEDEVALLVNVWIGQIRRTGGPDLPAPTWTGILRATGRLT